MIHPLEWLHLKGKYTKRLQECGATEILIQRWWKIQHVSGTKTNTLAVPIRLNTYHVTSNSTPIYLPWYSGTTGLLLSLQLFEDTHGPYAHQAHGTQHCVLVFKRWICLAMLRSRVSLQGEKYNWSSLQGLSWAGGNDFRPTNLYFIVLFKKLFNSLIS